MPARREPTATSAFGVSRRESHDASTFYARFTPPVLSDDARIAAAGRDVDAIFANDARSMPQIADRSVALVVTSPPYFAGKEYEAALGEGHVPGTYVDYLQMLEDVFAECVRTLEPGGRIAVNVANLGRRPYRSLSADVIQILQDKLRLLLRGEVIWQKAKGAAGNCAWGSFQKPANPVLRDLTERIVVASKGRFDRAQSYRDRQREGLPSTWSLSRDDFMELTTDVWEMPAESASRVGHPAPFPVELPERLIHLYTYRGDLVLDPFMGAGTTAIAAVRTGRHFAGYETEAAYREQAERRIAAERERAGVVLPAPAGRAPDPARDGLAARDIARSLLDAAGFTGVTSKARCPGGLEVTFRALDPDGRPWLFEVAGASTTYRAGLRRADVLWKVIGQAAVLHETGASQGRFVVLTADVPETGTPNNAALRAVTGPGKPIRDVVCMLDAGAADHLARLR